MLKAVAMRPDFHSPLALIARAVASPTTLQLKRLDRGEIKGPDQQFGRMQTAKTRPRHFA